MNRNFRFEIVYPYPVDKVWKALTDSSVLAKWLMENDFKPETEHKFQFRAAPSQGFDGIISCEVMTLEENKRLSYSWKGDKIDTLVSFTLEPEQEGTRLILEHKGFEGFKERRIGSRLAREWKKKKLSQNLPKVLAGL